MSHTRLERATAHVNHLLDENKQLRRENYVLHNYITFLAGQIGDSIYQQRKRIERQYAYDDNLGISE